jgi:hypothetical protein
MRPLQMGGRGEKRWSTAASICEQRNYQPVRQFAFHLLHAFLSMKILFLISSRESLPPGDTLCQQVTTQDSKTERDQLSALFVQICRLMKLQQPHQTR